MSDSSFDFAVVGGGIVGLATALALVRRGHRSVLVLEAEDRVAAHQTGHNSGVIHSGLYYKPGSLKATLCAAGREAMFRFCADHGIPHDRCGKLVIASSEAELPALEELERRGRANGLGEIRRLGREAMREREPEVAGIAGLLVPETGIVDYKQVAARYAELIREGGGEVRTGTPALSVQARDDGITIGTAVRAERAAFLVNCGGLHSDRVARMCGLRPDVRIIPFRGEYYELAPERRHLVKHLIYPVPDPSLPFLGVHLTRMIGGGVEAGPNAVLALARHGYRWSDVSARDIVEMAAWPGLWRLMSRFWRTGIAEVRRSLSRRAFLASLRVLVPALGDGDLRPAGAGVRAQAVARDGKLVDDFRILEAPRMIHVLNAPSPAATASLAIGEAIAGRALDGLVQAPTTSVLQDGSEPTKSRP